jgi:hypothetical protein
MVWVTAINSETGQPFSEPVLLTISRRDRLYWIDWLPCEIDPSKPEFYAWWTGRTISTILRDGVPYIAYFASSQFPGPTISPENPEVGWITLSPVTWDDRWLYEDARAGKLKIIYDGNRETGTVERVKELIGQGYSVNIVEEFPPLPRYTLTISAGAGGTTDPAPGSYEYEEETSVRVTAIPYTGYAFDHWTLDGSIRSENPITVTMDSNYSLTAAFKKVEAPPPPPPPPPPPTAPSFGWLPIIALVAVGAVAYTKLRRR